ncbi:MAG: translation initiation factor [Candidatus Dependentiae bacterium]|nr:translation initiation factor [Candidatus Dependentiae bacterium]
MRISEYAKEHNLQPRDVVDTLKQNGHQVTDQSSELNGDMTALLDRTIGGSNSRPRGPRPGGDAGARGPRPPRPVGDRSSTAPYAPRTPRPAGATGDAKPEAGATTWRRPATAGGRPEATAGAATALVDKKTSTKKGAAPKKRTAKKEKDDTDVEATTVQQSNRTNRETIITPPLVESVIVKGDMPLIEAAELLRKPISEVIFVLLKNGIAKNVHAIVTPSDMAILGTAFSIGITVEEAPKQKHSASVSADKKTNSIEAHGEQRLPIVVVMGHVDHGKTTLLDYLRKTNVVAKEKGGITQHLSAYEVKTGNKSSIFLDTPGHEAFSAMRTRGTRITDIAVIIVAVNDGLKPQTIEAIKLAQQAAVPIVVAINKIDKLDSEAQLETIRTQLAQHGLTPEEWGGDTVCVKISAKTGQGVNDLLDMLGLVAEMLDLKTTTKLPARAFVLETRQLKGHGLAVTVICREGILRRGDHFTCGQTTGKVRLLIDSYGAFVDEVGPSIPVQVIGFDEAHGLGDYLDVVSAAEYQEARANAHNRKPATMSTSSKQGQSADTPGLRLMFKADVQGSCQAIIDAIGKMEQHAKNNSIRIELLSCEVGPITESDVIRASDTGAILFGLHVRADKNAQAMAKEKRVEIILHDIIYHLFEQIEALIKTERRKIIHLVEAGKAEVLKVFPIKGHKVIAGCMIKEGILKIGDKVVCTRSRQEIGSGKVITLQRDRKEAKEIYAGNDCGLLTDSFHDWAVGDRITIFTHQQEEE